MKRLKKYLNEANERHLKALNISGRFKYYSVTIPVSMILVLFWSAMATLVGIEPYWMIPMAIIHVFLTLDKAISPMIINSNKKKIKPDDIRI